MPRDTYNGSWSEVHRWQKPPYNIIQTTMTGWNGDEGPIDIHIIDGSYYVGGQVLEYGCHIQRDPSSAIDLVYFQTGYLLDSYEEGMAIQEGIGMKWVYNLVAFSVEENRLTKVPINLTGNPDPDDKTHRIACEDVNNDGLVDIVVATWDPEAYPHVYLNQGSNNFSLVRDDVWPRMTEAHSGNIYADVNKDGIHDIVYFPGPRVRTSATSEIRYEIHYGKRVMSAQDTYDSDSDGILNNLDAFPLDASEQIDTDGDGIGNNADTDDDDDSIPDSEEISNGTNPLLADTDADGVNDNIDIFPLDATESLDTDSDGTGNNADTDDDNDTVLDVDDAFPLDATESVDTDSDGTGNNADTDDDNDGVSDFNDSLPLDPENDSDGDGVPNNIDVYPENSLYIKDSDLDGMPDAWEIKYGLDPNDASDATSDRDNDGISALDEFLAGTIPSGSIDLDGNEDYDALTDGLLLLRGMFGLDGSALVTGTIASDATYTESVDIESRIATLGDLADIDGNGDIDALTDGLLTLRYLFGLQGDTLINGVVASDATRKTAEEIEAHLKTLMPAL